MSLISGRKSNRYTVVHCCRIVGQEGFFLEIRDDESQREMDRTLEYLTFGNQETKQLLSWKAVEHICKKMLNIPCPKKPLIKDSITREALDRKRYGKPPKPDFDNIYFIQCGACVKIGKSDHPQSRLKVMSNGNPYPLHLLLEYKADLKEEKRLHSLFAEDRIYKHREWFLLSDKIRDYIEEKSSVVK